MATHSSILALENPMDRGVWQATVHRATQSQKQLKRMSTIPHIHETNKNIHMIFSKVVKYLTKLNIMMEIFSKLLIEENSGPLQYSCLGESYGQRSLVGYGPWSCKESDTTERLKQLQGHIASWSQCIRDVIIHDHRVDTCFSHF